MSAIHANAVYQTSYGPELVVNGGFDTSANWTYGASWNINGGKASCSSASANLYQLTDALQGTLVTGFDIVTSGGSVRVYLVLDDASIVGTSYQTAVGTYSEELSVPLPRYVTELRIDGGSGVEVDNITMKNKYG